MKEIQCENLDELIKEMKKNGDWDEGTLYRGHANSSWELTSTLERFINRNVSVRDYDIILLEMSNEFTSRTGLTFHSLSLIQQHNKIKDPDLPFLDMMIYARQHGFPSPLIDFSRSFYIALSFALYGLTYKADNESFAIIAIKDKTVEDSKEVTKVKIPGWFAPHPRHYNQQAEYLYNISKPANSEDYYSPITHNVKKDEFRKYVVSFANREDIMRTLKQTKTDPYALFPSEESLMQSFAWDYLYPYLKEVEEKEVEEKEVEMKLKVIGFIEDLGNSTNFKTSHYLLGKIEEALGENKKLSSDEITAYLAVAISNSQVSWLLRDDDFKEFFKERIEHNLIEDQKSKDIYDQIAKTIGMKPVFSKD